MAENSPYSRVYSATEVVTGAAIKAVFLNDEYDVIFDAIGTGGITATELADEAVVSAKIKDVAVTPAKLADPFTFVSQPRALAGSSSVTLATHLTNKDYVDDKLETGQLCKAWAKFTIGADPFDVTVDASFNIASDAIVRDSAGTYTITFTTAFESEHYVCLATITGPPTTLVAAVSPGTQAADEITIVTVDAGASATDNITNAVFVVFFGDQ